MLIVLNTNLTYINYNFISVPPFAVFFVCKVGMRVGDTSWGFVRMMQVDVYKPVPAQVKCLHTGGPRSTAGVVISCPLPYFLRKYFSLNLGLISSARLTGQ